jgi:hypothetical protein
VYRVDAEGLWPHVTLAQVHALRELPPLGPGDDPAKRCPVCSDQAFLSADRRILYCLWTCQRAMPGPASDQLLQALRRRRPRRGRTIRRTM